MKFAALKFEHLRNVVDPKSEFLKGRWALT